MLGVDTNDARPVHPLDVDDQVIVGLHDCLQVVVGDRTDRDRSGWLVDAAHPKDHRVRAVERRVARFQPPRRAVVLHPDEHRKGRAAGLPGVRQGRQSSVRRVRQHRRAVVPVDLEHLMAGIEPGVVVALRVDECPLFRRRTVRIAGRVAGGHPGGLAGLDRGNLLGAQHQLLAALRSALEGRQRADVVAAGEVGLAAGGSGNLVAGREGGGSGAWHEQQGTQR